MRKLKFALASLVMVCFAGLLTAQELIPTPVEVSYKGKKRVKVEQVYPMDENMSTPSEGTEME